MLSVIIPTRNRSAFLHDALASIVRQTIPQEEFEVIVIDNGSVDDTRAVVESFRSSLKNLRYVSEVEPGLHAGRHRGSREARSELLVYADDDIVASPSWLQAIGDSFADGEVVLVGGKCLPSYQVEPPTWLRGMWAPKESGDRILGYLSLIDLGDQVRAVHPCHVFGCNFAIRRTILIEAGGFHPDAMPQELIRFRGDGETHVSRFIEARGYKALYNPLASIHHRVPADRMTVEYFCRRAYNQGVSDSYSAIRGSNGVLGDPVDATTGVWDACRRMLGDSLKEVTGWGFALFSGVRSGGPAVLRRKVAAAYQKGYAYHQKQVRESPELLAWVLRPSYWDCTTQLDVKKEEE